MIVPPMITKETAQCMSIPTLIDGICECLAFPIEDAKERIIVGGSLQNMAFELKKKWYAYSKRMKNATHIATSDLGTWDYCFEDDRFTIANFKPFLRSEDE